MCVYVALFARITITQSYTHTMQQTHKAVTGSVEAKKLLSHRRQWEYSQRNLDVYVAEIQNILNDTSVCHKLHTYYTQLRGKETFAQ